MFIARMAKFNKSDNSKYFLQTFYAVFAVTFYTFRKVKALSQLLIPQLKAEAFRIYKIIHNTNHASVRILL